MHDSLKYAWEKLLQVLFSMANSSMEVIDIEIVWVGVSKVHKIEILDHASCKSLIQ